MTSVAIIGGGPGGYEAALVAQQLGAEVIVIDRDGLGGSAVLTDCVPSKTLIATSDLMTEVLGADELGIGHGGALSPDLKKINARVRSLAAAQSYDIESRLTTRGIKIVRGVGRLSGGTRVHVSTRRGREEDYDVDAVLIATGARPRVLDSAVPDGERILTWEQVYDLDVVPTNLIVVGSGVTGAEFASAYLALGVPVTLISSREHVLPGEDADAAEVLEDVLVRRGMTLLEESRMESVKRSGDVVTVTLSDGRTVEGSHCILALGSVPNTEDIGLAEAGVHTDKGGFIHTDKVSRTSAPGIYAAGDCTGGFMLASVAAMAGRIAMRHLLGDAVQPLDLKLVSSNVFTSPEIATVGVTQSDVDNGIVSADVMRLDLSGNPRAKMQGIKDGFVKLIALKGSGIVVGGVVVGPRASELIHPISLAVSAHLTVDQVAAAYTIYPSVSGSIAEVARRLHTVEE